jgi:hypothetical protein
MRSDGNAASDLVADIEIESVLSLTHRESPTRAALGADLEVNPAVEPV